MLAKMATRKAKPNGQFYLRGNDVLEFMKEQSVQSIPGTQHFVVPFSVFFKFVILYSIVNKSACRFPFLFTYNSEDFDSIHVFQYI